MLLLPPLSAAFYVLINFKFHFFRFVSFFFIFGKRGKGVKAPAAIFIVRRTLLGKYFFVVSSTAAKKSNKITMNPGLSLKENKRSITLRFLVSVWRVNGIN